MAAVVDSASKIRMSADGATVSRSAIVRLSDILPLSMIGLGLVLTVAWTAGLGWLLLALV